MQVNVTKRIDTADGKRYCPVVVAANGRIKPDWVMVNGRQEKHPEGAYYLDWNESGKRKRVSVGKDAAAAYNSQIRKQAELRAIAEAFVGTKRHKSDRIPTSVAVQSPLFSRISSVFSQAQKGTCAPARLSAAGRTRCTQQPYDVTLSFTFVSTTAP